MTTRGKFDSWKTSVDNIYVVEIASSSFSIPMTMKILIKSFGKKVIIVTEGPQDAQEWTIEELGLRHMLMYSLQLMRLGSLKSMGCSPPCWTNTRF